jgi:hypothetical protein
MRIPQVYRKYAVVGASAVIALAIMSFTPQAHSQSAPSITGYLWSPNVGAIALDCNNQSDPKAGGGNNCALHGNWGLTVSGTTVTGYAWGENIGWVSANAADTAGCGAGGTTYNSSTHKLSGWLKAIAADGNGWDGCIKLNGSGTDSGTGASFTYQVDTDANASYNPATSGAWGSDVVGWLGAQISGGACVPVRVCSGTGWTDGCGGSDTCSAPNVCVNGTGCTLPTMSACLSIGVNATLPDCAGEVSSARVAKAGNTTIYWSAQPSDIDSCTLKEGMVLKRSGLSGGYSRVNITTPLVYTLTCVRGSQTLTKQVTISLVPVYKEQ